MSDVELETALGARLRRAEGTRLSRLLMARFPFTLGRIDWRRARDVVELPAPAERARGANQDPGGLQTSAHVEVAIAFFRDRLRQAGVTDEWVGFVGDGMEHEYEVRLDALPELLRAVAEVSEHKYVFGLDGSWCSMWSFEDDLFFGRCP